jgi:hypothetical protein
MKRRRKGGHPQHLPKVGTHPQAAAEQHREREAVLDVMGVHHDAGSTHWFTWVAIALIVVVAVLGAMSLAFID